MTPRSGAATARFIAGVLATATLAACAAARATRLPDAPAVDGGPELLVPPGYGTLRQDEITLSLRAGDLQLKVTPLEEWVLRLTAPDTWSRLSSLASTHRVEVTRRTGVEDASLFLVSFFSRTPGETFRPEDVELVNRGRRYRPLLIRPVTNGWGSQRLDTEETQLAVYAFPADVDLDQGVTLEYGTEAAGWDEIQRRLELERSRARARSGGGPE